MIEYHDSEWGVPVHDDMLFFEFLILEGAQAGLSWETVLKRRAGYREVYDGFDVASVAAYGGDKTQALLADSRIIRNRSKVAASVGNARAFIAVQEEFGSFDAYVWGFVDGEPVRNSPQSMSDVPATTELSDRLSADLKRRGFKFVGPTICYAFLQATGLVNDHMTTCFRYKELAQKAG